MIACGCSRAESPRQPKDEPTTPPGSQSPTNKEVTVKISETRSGEWTPNLNDAERATLFAIARDTLDWCVHGSRDPFSFQKYAITDRLRKEMATFVTLKRHGMLRGCIGSLAPTEALYRSIHDNAVSAALRDFRFRPVKPEELKDLDVHLSILSPIVGIPSVDQFKIGEHGIIVEKGRFRAVFLPEVAVEQKWTKEETLGHLSEKAGMDRDGWRQGARFKVFSSVALGVE
jgi:AmmeMemoRadiSam system protein A